MSLVWRSVKLSVVCHHIPQSIPFKKKLFATEAQKHRIRESKMYFLCFCASVATLVLPKAKPLCHSGKIYLHHHKLKIARDAFIAFSNQKTIFTH